MTRIGWLLLLLFGAAVVIFGLMVAGGGEVEPAPPAAPRPDPETIAVGSLVIPVAGVKPGQLENTWGDARGGGTRTHNAIDIMAPRGTPVMAAAPGTVEKLFDSRNGGLTVYVRSGDQARVYYYAHLDSYRPGLVEGQRLNTGDVLGAVGSTGSASDTAPHLHFEVKEMGPGEKWYQGREVNPYPLLTGR